MASEPAERNWFARNWKWLVPVGCLSMLLLFLASLALMATFVFGLLRESDVYGEALERARGHPGVRAQLGEPLEPGMFVSGSIHVEGPGGDADLAIPLAGPAGEGTLYVVADREAGQWQFRRLEFEGAGRRIDLLAPADP